MHQNISAVMLEFIGSVTVARLHRIPAARPVLWLLRADFEGFRRCEPLEQSLRNLEGRRRPIT